MAFLPFIGAAAAGAGAGATAATAATVATTAAAGAAAAGGLGAVGTSLLALTAGGTALSTLSGIQAARFNQDVANRNAALAAQKGQIDAAALRRQSRAEQGRRIASIAASGLDPGFGSAASILRTSAEQDEFDALLLEQGAASRVAGFGAEAGFQRRRAVGAGVGGAFGVGTSILRGVNRA